MPINNIQQFRVRFSFVNQSSVNGEPFKYSDNATYFTIRVKMNNSGRVFRFTGGETDLNIELYTASAQ